MMKTIKKKTIEKKILSPPLNILSTPKIKQRNKIINGKPHDKLEKGQI
jgi:hypothetical protein